MAGAAALASTVLAACSGGSPVPIAAKTPACALFTQMAAAGKEVARADVGDPDTFDATLRRSVNEYVTVTKRLRAAVPFPLRSDVDRLTAAAQQYRFADAKTAQAHLASYARAKCGTGAKT
jgi:hypothetical protein